MKIRNGFVSNSSSSSFTIKIDELTDKQLYYIKNHIDVCKLKQFTDFRHRIGFRLHECDAWELYEQDGYLTMETSMDNFDMVDFLEYIGVDTNKLIENWNHMRFYNENT